jgi:hypothetical protein
MYDIDFLDETVRTTQFCLKVLPELGLSDSTLKELANRLKEPGQYIAIVSKRECFTIFLYYIGIRNSTMVEKYNRKVYQFVVQNYWECSQDIHRFSQEFTIRE